MKIMHALWFESHLEHMNVVTNQPLRYASYKQGRRGTQCFGEAKPPTVKDSPWGHFLLSTSETYPEGKISCFALLLRYGSAKETAKIQSENRRLSLNEQDFMGISETRCVSGRHLLSRVSCSKRTIPSLWELETRKCDCKEN